MHLCLWVQWALHITYLYKEILVWNGWLAHKLFSQPYTWYYFLSWAIHMEWVMPSTVKKHLMLKSSWHKMYNLIIKFSRRLLKESYDYATLLLEWVGKDTWRPNVSIKTINLLVTMSYHHCLVLFLLLLETYDGGQYLFIFFLLSNLSVSVISFNSFRKRKGWTCFIGSR